MCVTPYLYLEGCFKSQYCYSQLYLYMNLLRGSQSVTSLVIPSGKDEAQIGSGKYKFQIHRELIKQNQTILWKCLAQCLVHSNRWSRRIWLMLAVSPSILISQFQKSSPEDFQVHTHLHFGGGPGKPCCLFNDAVKRTKVRKVLALWIFMEFSMSVLTSQFLIFCDLSFMSAEVNKWEPLNSCTIWGTFHSPVVGLCRGSVRIRHKKADRHFN